MLRVGNVPQSGGSVLRTPAGLSGFVAGKVEGSAGMKC